MSKPKFTPGPWTATLGMRTIRVKRGDRFTAIGMDAQAECDANLIAAAPDMYEALKGVCNICEYGLGVTCGQCPVPKALAKAEGLTHE